MIAKLGVAGWSLEPDAADADTVIVNTCAFIDPAKAESTEVILEHAARKRKAGEADAAADPLSEPDVKAAVQRATFELLLGFQLDQAQLAYNATR